MGSFAEFVDVRSKEPLRQGDVLQATDSSAIKWQRHLLVITADCDFAYAKHQGRVTCIPLLTADEYLMEFHVPKIRDRLVKKPLQLLQTSLRTAGIKNLTSARVRQWILEDGADAAISSLSLAGAELSSAAEAIRAIELIDSLASNTTLAAEALVDAQLIGSNPPKRVNAVETVAAPLREAFLRPPGDAMFLSSIGRDHRQGYFAYLRHLEQVWEREISTGPTNREMKYRRISRVQDRFTHALVQKFGMVFMSIGLPTEYEEMRDLHADLVKVGLE